jgi:hypothetical protein
MLTYHGWLGSLIHFLHLLLAPTSPAHKRINSLIYIAIFIRNK